MLEVVLWGLLPASAGPVIERNEKADADERAAGRGHYSTESTDRQHCLRREGAAARKAKWRDRSAVSVGTLARHVSIVQLILATGTY